MQFNNNPKMKKMHYLLTLMLFQTCVSFFFMLITKEDILKDLEETNSCWSQLTSIVGKVIHVDGDHQLFNYQHSSMFNIRKKLIQVWNDMRG